MKLTPADVSNLSNILSTCAAMGIESVIVEESAIRGINADRTCVILSSFGVPKLSQTMGIGRIKELKQRIELFGDSVSLDAKESERGEISSLEISAGKTKATFRCASTVLIKAPKTINDTLISRVFISKEEMKMILNAARVMGGSNVTMTIKKDRSAIFQMQDATNDSFNITLNTPVERLDGETDVDSVTHYYEESVFSSIMRAQDSDIIAFDVGSIGIIRINLNGHAMTVLPKINEDGDNNE